MLRFIRRPAFVEKLGTTDSGLDRMIRDRFAPPPVKLSPDPQRRAVGWPEYEADELVAARMAGLDPDATRALVADLIERRTRAREAA